jgi:hypothetical protein
MSVANLVTRGIGPGSSIGELVTAGFASGEPVAPATYSVGVYYFPGWSTPGGGPFPSDPWGVIPADRLPPVLGAYDETQQSVCDQNLTWMYQYGLTFVAIDWFQKWSGSTLVPYLDHFINLYLTSSVDKPPFCLQYANQTNAGGLNNSTWQQIPDFWIAEYFPSPNYYKINGYPVVIVNSHPSFRDRFASHAEVKTMLDNARAAAVLAGFPGIIFMAGHADSSSAWIDVTTPADGWDGVTGSNVYTTTRVSDNAAGPSPTTYADLDNAVFSGVVGGYRGFCNGWMNGADIDLFWPPCTAGFDSTPWSPSTTLHGMPTSSEWGDHLANCKALLDANGLQTQKTFMIEAWNEHGEGSLLIPTAGNGGFDRLGQLAITFDLPTVLAFSLQPYSIVVGSTSAAFRFAASGSGDITYRLVVVADGATAPTAAEVLAGTASGGGAAVYASESQITIAGAQVDVSAASLTAETAYDVYIAIDDSESTAVLATKVDITTGAATSTGIIRSISRDICRDITRNVA